jgi:hypothetical protein
VSLNSIAFLWLCVAQVRYTLESSLSDQYPKLKEFADQIDRMQPLTRDDTNNNPADAFRLVREQVGAQEGGIERR